MGMGGDEKPECDSVASNVTHITFRGILLASRSRMPVRDFTDSAGTHWRVWSTTPSSRMVLTEGYEDGWLTFEANGIIRRLAPIPSDWERATAPELERLCQDAKRHMRRAEREGLPPRRPGGEPADHARP